MSALFFRGREYGKYGDRNPIDKHKRSNQSNGKRKFSNSRNIPFLRIERFIGNEKDRTAI